MSRLARVFGRSRNLKDAVINAGIMAGYVFFTTLMSGVATGVGLEKAAVTAGISAGVMFFTRLAVERGLLKDGEGGKSARS